MCLLFIMVARCASAGDVKVTKQSPDARPSRWPRTTPPGTTWKPAKKRITSSTVERKGMPRIRRVEPFGVGLPGMCGPPMPMPMCCCMPPCAPPMAP